MNKKQKTCLLVGIAATVVMGLFPPWVIQSREFRLVGRNKGYEHRYTTEPGPYSWIGDPPQGRPLHSQIGKSPEERATPSWVADPPQARPRFIDLYRLGLQYFVVAVVTAGLIITFRDEKATKQ